MSIVTIKRSYETPSQTVGTLYINDKNFQCFTLELPWCMNQKNISCIPKGQYICHHTFSTRFLRSYYEVLAVPYRAGIRIHPANFSRQLRGCIALGNDFSYIDKDGTRDITNSRKTVQEFEQILEKKKFVLVIE